MATVMKTCRRFRDCIADAVKELRRTRGVSFKPEVFVATHAVEHLRDFRGEIAMWYDGIISLCDGARVKRILVGDHTFLCMVEFGEFIATGSPGTDFGTVTLWDRDGRVKYQLRGHSCYVRTLCIFGDFLASGSGDRTIKLWDENGICVRTLTEHSRAVNDLVVFNGLLASASEDETIKLWDVSGTCTATLMNDEPPRDPILAEGMYALCTFVGFLVSLGDNQAIRLWEASGTCAKIFRLGEHESHCTMISSDRFLAVASDERICILNSDIELAHEIHRFYAGIHPPIMFWKGRLVEGRKKKILVW